MKNQAATLDRIAKANNKTKISLFFGDINFFPATLTSNLSLAFAKLNNNLNNNYLISETSIEENNQEFNIEGFFPIPDLNNNLTRSQYSKNLLYLSPKSVNENSDIYSKLIRNIQMEGKFSRIFIDMSRKISFELIKQSHEIVLFQNEGFKNIKKNYILIKQLKEQLTEEEFENINFKIVFVTNLEGISEANASLFVEDFITLTEVKNMSFLTSIRVNDKVIRRTSLLKNFFIENIIEDIEETKHLKDMDLSEQHEILNNFQKFSIKV